MYFSIFSYRRHALFLGFLFMLVCMIASQVWAAGNITIQSIEEKWQGDYVAISGTAASDQVIVKVFAPDQTLLYFRTEQVSNGMFHTSFKLADDAKVGVYSAVVGYETAIASKNFLVKKKVRGLTNLTISDGTLTPAFSPQTFAYHAQVSNETKKLAIAAFADSLNLKINGEEAQSGVAKEVDLIEGLNQIEIKAMNPADNSIQRYTLTVTRQAAEVAYLQVSYPENNSILLTKKPTISGIAQTSKREAAANQPIDVYVDGKKIGRTSTGMDGSWSFIPVDPLGEGEHQVSGKAQAKSGNEIASSPVSFTVNTSNTLTLVTNPSSIVADGKSQVTVTASLKEGNGSPLRGENVKFLLGDKTESAVTDNQGNATVVFTPEMEGLDPKQDIIKAIVEKDGKRLESSVVIQYMPASIEGIVKDPIKDQPVSGAEVDVAEDFNNDGIIDFTALVTTGPDGRYKINVPRGNWTYTPKIRVRIKVGNHDVLLPTVTQKAEVGQIKAKGQTISSAKSLNSLLLMTDRSGGEPKEIGQVLGGGEVFTQIYGADGQVIEAQSGNGSAQITDIPPGEYQVVFQVQAPDGTKLAGNSVKIKVTDDGEAAVSITLIDPYGVVTDTVTGKPIEGVKMNLYWSDTETNKKYGRVPNTEVPLPELPDFPPNQNKVPQYTNKAGEYAWMVFPDGDYYLVAEKAGYETFDSRKDSRTENIPPDSYIKNGVIHVGEAIVKYDLQMKPISGGGSGGGSGGSSTSNPKETPKPENPTPADYHERYIQGYPDGTFKPENPVTRAEMASLLARSLNDVQGQTGAVYPDVARNHWAMAAIQKVNAAKIMVGDTNGNFHPNATITRAEMAMIAAKVKNLSLDKQMTSFTDVAQKHWAGKAIEAVKRAGIMNGYKDGTFHPNQSLTRAEAVKVLNSLLNRGPLQGVTKATWPDVPLTHWASPDIEEASANHTFIKQTDGKEKFVSTSSSR